MIQKLLKSPKTNSKRSLRSRAYYQSPRIQPTKQKQRGGSIRVSPSWQESLRDAAVVGLLCAGPVIVCLILLFMYLT
jgi:hypothetical protein